PPFNDDGDDKPRKYYVGDVVVKVLSERIQYVDKDGKLITESLIDYTRKNILQQYARLDQFLRSWTAAEKKQAIIDELQDDGVLLEAVRQELGKTELDDFDLICHIAYDKKPLTKQERAANVKKRHYLYKYSDLAEQVIAALLDKYANDGIKEIEETKVLQLEEFAKIGSPMKIVKAFGGKEAYQKAVQELENEIYYA
ncbi:restriction endonuclease subunit R, partial [Acetobacterium fimetarium]